MFNLVKPGHVLRFGTCPSTIISPHGAMSDASNDNTQINLWPAANTLGHVQCLSHPSGAIGAIAADVAKQRSTPGSVARTMSYSALGRSVTASNRAIGQETCDFVGYVDGQTNYIPSQRAVFSKDFSGCLMAVYTINGQRRVAHVAASAVAKMNCKQTFLTAIQGDGTAHLLGWFRPYTDAVDGQRKFTAIQTFGKHFGNDPNRMTTFGVVTANNQGYSVDAFRPNGIQGNDWVVTHVAPQTLSQSFIAP